MGYTGDTVHLIQLWSEFKEIWRLGSPKGCDLLFLSWDPWIPDRLTGPSTCFSQARSGGGDGWGLGRVNPVVEGVRA